MPILSSFGALRRTTVQTRQNYSANFNDASYCTFSAGSLSPGSSPFSVEFFLNMTAIPAAGTQDVILDFGYSALASGMRIRVDEYSTITASISTSSSTYTLINSTPISAGVWVYVAVSRVSGGSTRLFVNTTAGTSQSITASISMPSNRFGTGVNTLTTSFLNGRIASLRYNNGTGFSTATIPTAPLTATAQTQILTFQTPTLINEVGGAAPSTNTGVTVSQTGPF